MDQEPVVKTMQLPVGLSEGELALRAQELATAERELGEAEKAMEQYIEASKSRKQRYQVDIASARAEVRRLAAVVRERTEARPVPVMEEADYEAGAIHTYRTDTNVVVGTRGMSPEERQRSLFEVKNKKQPS